MCPCRTVRSEPRTVGVSPAQEASLRALPNRLMSPISASMTSAVNWPTPGSVVRVLTRGSALACWRSPAYPVDHRRQAIDHRQAVGDDLPRHRGQDPARPASRGRARTGSCRTGRSRNRPPPGGSGCAAGCPAGPVRPGAAAARGAAGPLAGRSTPPGAGPRAATGLASRRRPLSFFSRQYRGLCIVPQNTYMPEVTLTSAYSRSSPRRAHTSMKSTSVSTVQPSCRSQLAKAATTLSSSPRTTPQ